MRLTIIHGATGRSDDLIRVLGDLGLVTGPVISCPGFQVVVFASRRTLGLFLDVPNITALLQPLLPEAESTGAALAKLWTPLAVELLDLCQTVVAILHW